jgi:hypothetical protein
MVLTLIFKIFFSKKKQINATQKFFEEKLRECQAGARLGDKLAVNLKIKQRRQAARQPQKNRNATANGQLGLSGPAGEKSHRPPWPQAAIPSGTLRPG